MVRLVIEKEGSSVRILDTEGKEVELHLIEEFVEKRATLIEYSKMKRAYLDTDHIGEIPGMLFGMFLCFVCEGRPELSEEEISVRTHQISHKGKTQIEREKILHLIKKKSIWSHGEIVKLIMETTKRSRATAINRIEDMLASEDLVKNDTGTYSPAQFPGQLYFEKDPELNPTRRGFESGV